MQDRKFGKTGEKIAELRNKFSREKEIIGEAIEELKDKLSRRVSSNGGGWVDLRMRLKELAEDLKEKSGMKH